MIHKLADRIVEGKRNKILKKKLSEESNLPSVEIIDKEGIINKEIEKIKPITRDMQVIQTLVEDPFHVKKHEIEQDPFPETKDYDWSFDDPKRKCRLFTFKDLWNHNYLLSEGSKFGGDFLVSPTLLIFKAIEIFFTFKRPKTEDKNNNFYLGILWRPPHVSCQVHRHLSD